MLFTKIQLDDFKPILARFEEKLVIEGASASRFLRCFVQIITHVHIHLLHICDMNIRYMS